MKRKRFGDGLWDIFEKYKAPTLLNATPFEKWNSIEITENINTEGMNTLKAIMSDSNEITGDADTEGVDGSGTLPIDNNNDILGWISAHKTGLLKLRESLNTVDEILSSIPEFSNISQRIILQMSHDSVASKRRIKESLGRELLEDIRRDSDTLTLVSRIDKHVSIEKSKYRVYTVINGLKYPEMVVRRVSENLYYSELSIIRLGGEISIIPKDYSLVPFVFNEPLKEIFTGDGTVRVSYSSVMTTQLTELENALTSYDAKVVWMCGPAVGDGVERQIIYKFFTNVYEKYSLLNLKTPTGRMGSLEARIWRMAGILAARCVAKGYRVPWSIPVSFFYMNFEDQGFFPNVHFIDSPYPITHFLWDFPVIPTEIGFRERLFAHMRKSKWNAHISHRQRAFFSECRISSSTLAEKLQLKEVPDVEYIITRIKCETPSLLTLFSNYLR